MARARTFELDTGELIEVDILKKLDQEGLYVVLHGSKKLVRHRDRLEALDEAARLLLGK